MVKVQVEPIGQLFGTVSFLAVPLLGAAEVGTEGHVLVPGKAVIESRLAGDITHHPVNLNGAVPAVQAQDLSSAGGGSEHSPKLRAA